MRRKLFSTMLLASLATLMVTGISIGSYESRTDRQTLSSDAVLLAEFLGRSSVRALRTDDLTVARQSLEPLRERPGVLAAALYGSNGALLAGYVREGSPEELPTPAPADSERFERGRFVVVRSIRENGSTVGVVYLSARDAGSERAWSYAALLAAVACLALALCAVLARWLHAAVIRPIRGITALALDVVERRDYSVRAIRTAPDEIGGMADAVNAMLAEMQRRTAALEASRRSLEDEIGERAAAEKALREGEKRYRTLTAALTSVVWTADRAGEFASEQGSWVTYTGQTEEEYRGTGWLRAFHANDRAAIERLWAHAANSKQALDCEARLMHATSGRHRIVGLRALPVLDAQGEVSEWVGTVSDIDDRKRAEDEIRRLNAELEKRVEERTAQLQEANRELEAFSFSVSHDLRAPLRAIDGFSEALLEDFGDQVTPPMRAFLDRIRAATIRMGQLIEDLLNLSRISRVEMQRIDVDVSLLARQAVAELLQREPERTVEMHVQDGIRANADPRLLRIALENLLGNAWKFTSKSGQARIEFGVLEEDGSCAMFVRDNGAGFDMAHANKLFGPFQRLHGASEFPGTGIGLATVQRIIQRHRGRIWCRAEPGRGAQFAFTVGEAGSLQVPGAPQRT